MQAWCLVHRPCARHDGGDGGLRNVEVVVVGTVIVVTVAVPIVINMRLGARWIVVSTVEMERCSRPR